MVSRYSLLRGWRSHILIVIIVHRAAVEVCGTFVFVRCAILEDVSLAIKQRVVDHARIEISLSFR